MHNSLSLPFTFITTKKHVCIEKANKLASQQKACFTVLCFSS